MLVRIFSSNSDAMPIQYIENINKSRSSYSLILRNDFSAETPAALRKHPLETLIALYFVNLN